MSFRTERIGGYSYRVSEDPEALRMDGEGNSSAVEGNKVAATKSWIERATVLPVEGSGDMGRQVLEGAIAANNRADARRTVVTQGTQLGGFGGGLVSPKR